jgi:hypothetical protein
VSLIIGNDNNVVNTRERINGYSVSAFLSDGKLRYLADIEEENGTTITRLYKWRSFAIGRDPWFGAAENCQYTSKTNQTFFTAPAR